MKARSLSRVPKKKISHAILNIQSTYNNTIVSLADSEGKVLMWSTSGSLGFNGAKKGTPFAAAKIGELLAEKAQLMGLKSVDAIVKGVGSGRESAIRAFIAKGVEITSIKDKTPVPHNGPRAKKPRRI
ncbi:MAG: 30S ribosomal protein S11 [Candidatus Lloydbacteria bacterium RIFCSPHIGHO2_01_FULL_49_22]|uniref:Small ribosomal subunit protein uS11 n=1 Tax=Candidatus Lloydbacteria bacterium RIFCSPHIGHO2_01_FULL_49_22 TaxID=1798658 RepID=A0A1G2CV33_9BACT|nr:MAG: 30S ribosomal protein S11 [Candidatus Lloydbacteria bacterium RIFCSPHIGHO2_01_FULL_49_22]OGZ10430.1 MAG: 30S ribosomal protein S11 [Candidatus Lloydbacteria bacterium RIFCSPHIGHO2_02_FULL_50_18]